MKSLRLDVIVQGLEGGDTDTLQQKKKRVNIVLPTSQIISLYVQEQVANMLLQTSETSFLGLGEGNLKPERRKKKSHRFKLM